MHKRRDLFGFSLITAIFLLAVVAGLLAYITNIRVVQETTAAYGIQGARAMQAARSGLEWGIYHAIVDDTCDASTTFVINRDALDAFSIQVDCIASTHYEGDPLLPESEIITYQLTSVASSGTFGSLDYVQRRLRATVSVDPP